MKNASENIERDLENILTSVAESVNFKNYKIISNNYRTHREGFLSEFFTGEVLNEDSGEKIPVAIKKAPIDGYSAGFRIEDIYKNEIYFYSEVFPTLNQYQIGKNVKYPFQYIPRYFSGSIESTNIFLTMENLKAKGYVLFDKKKYLDSEHLELVFKTYGKFHALSFSFKQKNGDEFENLTKNLTDMMEKYTESGDIVTMMKNSYLAALNAVDPVTEADYLIKLKTVENIPETLKKVKKYRGSYNCLIHGDCWSNNMLFKYKESGELEDIKLLDFQMIYSSTPVHDLSYFFYSGASKKDMDKLDYYLDLYYQSFSNFTKELGENPEEVLPLEVLKKEWKQYGVWGVFLGCQLWLAKLMNKDDMESVLDQKGLTTEDYFQLWNEIVSKVLADPDFIERAKNICLHAVEYGVIGS